MANDGVIITELSALPGVPVAYRLFEAKKADPKKLDLSRKELTVCPLVKGEDNLRLLNLQHNVIRKIEHLSIFTKMIYLDLYNNLIENIDGLSNLECLRVLILGRNRIKTISNLENLTSLDVLDLHGNMVS
ncbi:leucine-rich repeat-containing protein 49-like isoform X1 [Hydra vulgaris]|uniref:leucine-rich repeat-containing protein 49-like isoform X1 n=1 Tax=Hydra vulgaris TaxID=6087 RepID=UPI0032E9FB96